MGPHEAAHKASLHLFNPRRREPNDMGTHRPGTFGSRHQAGMQRSPLYKWDEARAKEADQKVNPRAKAAFSENLRKKLME